MLYIKRLFKNELKMTNAPNRQVGVICMLTNFGRSTNSFLNNL